MSFKGTRSVISGELVRVAFVLEDSYPSATQKYCLPQMQRVLVLVALPSCLLVTVMSQRKSELTSLLQLQLRAIHLQTCFGSGNAEDHERG